MSANLAEATSASTEHIIVLVKQQREEDQRIITLEFGKICSQTAELNKVVLELTEQVAASIGTTLLEKASAVTTSLQNLTQALLTRSQDVEFTESISSAKKQKNSQGLPNVPNIDVSHQKLE